MSKRLSVPIFKTIFCRSPHDRAEINLQIRAGGAEKYR